MENLLFKKDGIYVVIPEIDEAKYEEVKNDSNLVYHYGEWRPTAKEKSILYGGRVIVHAGGNEECYLQIDGIYLCRYNKNNWHKDDLLPLAEVCSYLNQIENLGVDTFLQNYKAQMQAMKDQLTEMSNQLVVELAMNEDKEKAKMLADIRQVLLGLICLICTLSIHLNAGLDNYKYVDAAESVMTQYCN